MNLTCEHPDCEARATLLVRSALGDVATCDVHSDATEEHDEHGRKRFAKWYRDACLSE